MMSKRQWFALLCLSIIYLLLGACFFYEVETREETKRRDVARQERKEIEDLLKLHYVPSMGASQSDIFDKLTEYCGKPMHTNMSLEEDPRIWDFYHALFFVITVFTTVGYGNLAPTTMSGRIFMIFYALVGVPMNGILMMTLGEFFGKTFTKLYNRFKTKKINDFAARLGIIGQICLYLLTGFTFFIFLPAVIIMIMEQWDYDVAVYYAFVTLTTIGFGDYVAGVNRPFHNGFDVRIFTAYQIFLLVWIIIGLGYGLMVIGFISRGMRSKQMHAIEHILAENLKRTPNKIRELRSLVHEIILIKMGIKPVFKKSMGTPVLTVQRSHSLPNLNVAENGEPVLLSVDRKRALSETNFFGKDNNEMHSDTVLNMIDKDLTFKNDTEQREKVLKCFDEFEAMEHQRSLQGINGFSDKDILESELSSYQWTISNRSQVYPTPPPSSLRKRALSECWSIENEMNNTSTWYGQTAELQQQEMRERIKHGRARSRTLPVQQEPLIKIPSNNLLSRLKNKLTPARGSKDKDIEKQEVPTPRPNRSRAFSECQDVRAPMFESDEEMELDKMIELLKIAFMTDGNQPKRKFGTASFTPPQQQSPLPARQFHNYPSRRFSMMPAVPSSNRTRTYSLRTDEELPPPPAYSPPSRRSRFTLQRVAANSNETPSPIQRQKIREASNESLDE